MIPYFEQPVWHLGPLSIHAFGVVTALALLAGLGITRRRALAAGLRGEIHEGIAWYAIGFGVVGAHLYSVLLYFPGQVAEDPLLLLRVWENISSTGGILGGALGIWVYFRRHPGELDPVRRRRHLDAAAWTLPFAWAIGRFACFLAHDHPGEVSEFFLARSLETEPAREYITGIYAAAGRLSDLPPPEVLPRLGFHDLGWYELLYLTLVMVPAFLVLDRKPRSPGFWVVAFVVLYAPARFLLDFLRVPDPTYGGLTPAQWGIVAVLIGAAGWLTSGRRFLLERESISAHDPSPDSEM